MRKRKILIVLPLLTGILLAGCQSENPAKIATPESSTKEVTSSAEPSTPSSPENGKAGDKFDTCKADDDFTESQNEMRKILLKTQDSARDILRKSPNAAMEELVDPYFNHDLGSMRLITTFGMGAKLNTCPIDSDNESTTFEVVDGGGKQLLRIRGNYDFGRIYIKDGGVHVTSEYEKFLQANFEETLNWPS